MNMLKVSSNTLVAKLASAIANEILTNGEVQVSAIGPGAVNQAVKGIAVANDFGKTDGFEITCLPEFKSIEVDGDKRTCIIFTVRKV